MTTTGKACGCQERRAPTTSMPLPSGRPRSISARSNFSWVMRASAWSRLATLLTRLGESKAFLADPDVDLALNIANATPLTATQQNRLNKALIRQARRNANLTAALARYVFGEIHPVLLDDVTDT